MQKLLSILVLIYLSLVVSAQTESDSVVDSTPLPTEELVEKDSSKEKLTSPQNTESNKNVEKECLNCWTFIDILKYTAWPITLLFILFFFKSEILNLIGRAKSIKVGDFQINLEEIAESTGVSNITENLKGLNYEELRYFYILGGDSSDRYQFKDTGKSPNEQRAIYQKLMDRSLLTFDEKEVEEDGKKLIQFHYRTTSIGRKTHKSLLDTVYSELIKLK